MSAPAKTTVLSVRWDLTMPQTEELERFERETWNRAIEAAAALAKADFARSLATRIRALKRRTP